MSQPETRTKGRNEENGRYLRPDDRDRYATERVGYATGAEGVDREPGWQTRSPGVETPDLNRPYRHQPPSGPGASPEVGPSSGPAYGGRPLGEPRVTSPASSRWYREPLTVAELMTRDVKTVTPETSLADVAALMRDEDVGVIPVVDGAGCLDGIVTDRDLVVRGVANDRSRPPAEIRAADISTKDVEAVSPHDSISSVLDLMGRKQIRRAPVVGPNRRLVGMISLGDIAGRADYDQELQEALQQISARRSFWSRIWR